MKTLPVVLATLTVLAHVAAASPPTDDYDEPEPEPDDDSPAFNMFGFALAVGALPIRGTEMRAMSLGLALEHPVWKKTRIAGEYDLLWLERTDDRAMHPEEHGTGHRASIALRRELVGRGGGSTRSFLDGELGGTVALVNDSMRGVSVEPGLFAGLRIGYDLYSRRDSSPSRTFETAIHVRAIALRDGAGLTAGLAMLWGN